MGDLKRIGAGSSHQSVGRRRIGAGMSGSIRPVTLVVSAAATLTSRGLTAGALIEKAADEQVVAMVDLKSIGAGSSHQSVGRRRIGAGMSGSIRPVTLVVSAAATLTSRGLTAGALIEKAADEQVVAMGDLKRIGAGSSHQSVG